MRARRIRVALTGLAIMAGLGGVALQHRWDQQCAAERPGSHWDGDAWLCLMENQR